MTASSERALVIKITTGFEELERLNQALTVAATALASGVTVSVWLTGEATWLAVPGRAQQVSLPHAMPLPDLLITILDAGSLTVCSQCAARRNLSDADLTQGVLIRGAAAFVEEIMAPGAQALVY